MLDTAGISIGVPGSGQYHPSAGFDGTPYLVVSHLETGTQQSFDLYGARVSVDGTVLDWPAFPISTEATAQFAPSLAFGTGRYLVVWTDHRNQFSAGRIDVYGALVDTLPGTIHVAPMPVPDFGNVPVGTSAPAQTVTVTNDGAANLVIGAITVGGTNPEDFVKEADGCSGHTLAPTGQCTVQVSFVPISIGDKNATLVIPSDAPEGSPVSDGLSGTGTSTLQWFPLTVAKAGSGSGSVTGSPAGIDCGSACSASYPSGTAVTLTATPAATSTFAGWLGAGCIGTGTCTVSMSAAAGVTATFTLSVFTLTVTRAGSADGAVASNPAGIACGSVCAWTYAAGTLVTLSATPEAGAAFARWAGACSGTAPSCAVTVTGSQSVTATFSKEFTDPAMTAKMTIIRAAHISDLRSAVNTLRSRLGLSPVSWTDPTLILGATAARAIHVTELRTALGQAYAAAGTAGPAYTDPALQAGLTVIKGAHLTELRNAVRALE